MDNPRPCPQTQHLSETKAAPLDSKILSALGEGK